MARLIPLRRLLALVGLLLAATSASASASKMYRGINLETMHRSNKRSSTVLHPEKKGEYEVTWEAALFILAKDGTLLRADGFVPKPKTSNETFPVVIFPNSWGVPQIEYITRAHNLAKRGYLTVEYETRGWYSSGGEIDVAGPLDRSDGSVVLDYITGQTQWHPNPGNIAFAGISYGAGISLMMAGYDTRVKTAVVMSGWNNLTGLLYGNEVPNKNSLRGLLGAAEANGKPMANLSTMFQDLELHQSMATLTSWANARTPQSYLDQYNSRQVPLFLSSNYLDHLFRPQYMLNEFFPKLTGPKHLLLNWGRHAIPEAIGLLDHHSKIWTEAYAWLDHYLKGEATGLESWPLIEAQHGGNLADPYVNLSDATAATTALYLGARVNGQGFGTMGGSGGSGVEAPITFTTDVGLKPPSATGQSLGELETTNLVKQNPATTVLYESEPFTTPVTVCGTPTIDLEFTATAPNWQFYPYLYAVGDLVPSEGVYMSFGFKNHYASGPTSGPVADQVGPNRWVLKGLQMHTICLTVPAGDRVAFGLVLYSPIYTPANDESSLGLSVVYGNNTKVNLPTPVFP